MATAEALETGPCPGGPDGQRALAGARVAAACAQPGAWGGDDGPADGPTDRPADGADGSACAGRRLAAVVARVRRVAEDGEYLRTRVEAQEDHFCLLSLRARQKEAEAAVRCSVEDALPDGEVEAPGGIATLRKDLGALHAEHARKIDNLAAHMHRLETAACARGLALEVVQGTAVPLPGAPAPPASTPRDRERGSDIEGPMMESHGLSFALAPCAGIAGERSSAPAVQDTADQCLRSDLAALFAEQVGSVRALGVLVGRELSALTERLDTELAELRSDHRESVRALDSRVRRQFSAFSELFNDEVWEAARRLSPAVERLDREVMDMRDELDSMSAAVQHSPEENFVQATLEGHRVNRKLTALAETSERLATEQTKIRVDANSLRAEVARGVEEARAAADLEGARLAREIATLSGRLERALAGRGLEEPAGPAPAVPRSRRGSGEGAPGASPGKGNAESTPIDQYTRALIQAVEALLADVRRDVADLWGRADSPRARNQEGELHALADQLLAEFAEVQAQTFKKSTLLKEDVSALSERLDVEFLSVWSELRAVQSWVGAPCSGTANLMESLAEAAAGTKEFVTREELTESVAKCVETILANESLREQRALASGPEGRPPPPPLTPGGAQWPTVGGAAAGGAAAGGASGGGVASGHGLRAEVARTAEGLRREIAELSEEASAMQAARSQHEELVSAVLGRAPLSPSPSPAHAPRAPVATPTATVTARACDARQGGLPPTPDAARSQASGFAGSPSPLSRTFMGNSELPRFGLPQVGARARSGSPGSRRGQQPPLSKASRAFAVATDSPEAPPRPAIAGADANVGQVVLALRRRWYSQTARGEQHGAFSQGARALPASPTQAGSSMESHSTCRRRRPSRGLLSWSIGSPPDRAVSPHTRGAERRPRSSASTDCGGEATDAKEPKEKDDHRNSRAWSFDSDGAVDTIAAPTASGPPCSVRDIIDRVRASLSQSSSQGS